MILDISMKKEAIDNETISGYFQGEWMPREHMYSLWRIDIIKILIHLIHKHDLSFYWLMSFKN